MSGHSKWHNIQQRKGQQDAKRANLFTKFAKGITIAAQSGGDPAMNFSLRLAIEKAKAVSMPKDNIDRAIKRGTGELAGARMGEALYEGFGPGGVAILIKAVMDNKNRTTSDLKHILTTHGGSFGAPGSVQWMFRQIGEVVVSRIVGSRNDFELAMIDAGAEDIIELADNELEIKTKVADLQKVLNKLKELNIETKESGLCWVAKEHVAVPPAVENQLTELFSKLEAHDDVEDYFTNAE